MGSIRATAKPHWLPAIEMAALAAALVISRWALLPKYLLTFDEVNFALSIDRFDPRLHQPQPPGYPVFVALLKLVAKVVPKVEVVFLVAGLLVSAAALFLIWELCERSIGRGSGMVGALLLLFNPVFWLAALTNPVRLCYAAGSLAVALCLWIANQNRSATWFVLGAAVLGFSAGARPDLAVVMTPLVLWTAWRMRIGIKAVAAALLAAAAAVALWFPELIAASGGLRTYLRMLREYSDNQMSGTSLLFGAPLLHALRMAWDAVAWSCLGTLSWIWAVPLVKKQGGPWAFLAVWFFPGLAFYAIFHVADPDHTLGIVPATCVAGAFLLNRMMQEAGFSKRALLYTAAAGLNAFLFFKPISVSTKPATYKPVQWIKAFIPEIIDGVGSLRTASPLTVIFKSDTIGWRHLSYYYPDLPLLMLLHENASLRVREITGRHVTEHAISNGTISLPSCTTVAWVDPGVPSVGLKGRSLRTTHFHVFFVGLVAGDSFEYDGVHFVVDDHNCAGTTMNRR